MSKRHILTLVVWSIKSMDNMCSILDYSEFTIINLGAVKHYICYCSDVINNTLNSACISEFSKHERNHKLHIPIHFTNCYVNVLFMIYLTLR